MIDLARIVLAPCACRETTGLLAEFADHLVRSIDKQGLPVVIFRVEQVAPAAGSISAHTAASALFSPGQLKSL